MSKVRLSDQALEDLSGIWLFIAKDNQILSPPKILKLGPLAFFDIQPLNVEKR